MPSLKQKMIRVAVTTAATLVTATSPIAGMPTDASNVTHVLQQTPHAQTMTLQDQSVENTKNYCTGLKTTNRAKYFNNALCRTEGSRFNMIVRTQHDQYAKDGYALSDPKPLNVPGYRPMEITDPMLYAQQGNKVMAPVLFETYNKHGDSASEYMDMKLAPPNPTDENHFFKQVIYDREASMQAFQKSLQDPNVSELAKIRGVQAYGNTTTSYEDAKLDRSIPNKRWVDSIKKIVRKGKGICVDQAVQKYDMLLSAGVNTDKLRFLVVRKPDATEKSGYAYHAVLGAKTKEYGTLILNNNALDEKTLTKDAPKALLETHKLCRADSFFGPDPTGRDGNAGWELREAYDLTKGRSVLYTADHSKQAPSTKLAKPDPKDHLYNAADRRFLAGTTNLANTLHDKNVAATTELASRQRSQMVAATLKRNMMKFIH